MSKLANEGAVMSEEVEISELVRPYLRRWWWFLLSFAVFISLAFLYLKVKTPVYNIKTSILIKDSKKTPSGELGMLSELGGLGSMGTNSIENEIQILKSKKLMRDVVETLGLQTTLISENGLTKKELYRKSSPVLVKVIGEKTTDKEFYEPLRLKITGDRIELTAGDLPKTVVTTFKKTISLPYANIMILENPEYEPSKTEGNDLFLLYAPIEKTVSGLQRVTDVDLVNKDATVLELSVNTTNRDKGRDIVNKLVEAYNSEAISDKGAESKKTKDFIDERIRIISRELGDVESEKQQFKVANQITDIPTEASLTLENASDARTRLLDVETQLRLTGDLISYLNNVGSSQTLPSSVGLSNPTASANINAYNQLILERNRLLENASPQNPVISDLSKQISSLRSSVMDALVKNQLAMQTARSQIMTEQQVMQSKIRKIPAQEKMFRSIERQQQIKENLYLLLLQKREEAAISLAITSPKARIIDKAFASEKPVAPNGFVVKGFAVVVSLLIPFGFIYLRELFNNKVRTAQQLENIGHAPLLGELPRVERGQNELIAEDDLSPMAEAFRILINNVSFMLPQKSGGKVIFFTSTVKGEGKTFVSVNYSLTLASSKNKVIIIGGDIRNPQLQRYNPSRKGLDGLTEYLYNPDEKLSDIIHTSSFNQHLDVIYSGSIPPNPTELLSNGRYEKLLSDLKTMYDYIVIDTAPLMLVTDTLLTADNADATVYVVRSGYTEKQLVEFANKHIDTNRIKNVGFALNDVSRDFLGYGNKYGYGYQAEDKGFFEKLRNKF